MKGLHTMRELPRQRWNNALVLLVAGGILAGCASPTRSPAPVEDRTASVYSQPAPGEAPRALPGAENAGKPGYYTVRPGDTLIRIALDTGQNWRDVVRWNNLENPNLIEVGQVLRIVPPAPPTASSEGVVSRPVASASVSATPVPAASAAASSLPKAATATASTTAPAATTSTVAPVAPVAPPAPAVSSADEDVAWGWPAPGNTAVIASFDEARNKGLDIAGKAGDPVLASADGRVVYAGAGLRGYGNLIILKHNNTYLTAYAHNQTLLVKEDQNVRKGQKIAEMGSSDTDRVKLHFEIRRQGKPVDPAKYLPAK